ncbi:MAG: response regulator transcription factor [Pseudomonadales bacterium]|nr:response regulator transcription factor [Pseudomonadales bacterium]
MTMQVILADDHRIVREGLIAMLSADPGIEVVGECGNGRDTIALARKLQPDLIVMDVSMPDLNGIDATRRIVEMGSNIKVVALSSHSDEQFVKGMLQAGASGYLLKECAGKELVLAIRTVKRGRVYVSPEVAGVIVNDYVSILSGDVKPQSPALSSREREVLQLIAEGQSTSQIGEQLHLSVKTVESHRKRIMDKLEIRNVAGLTKYAIREGITSLDG